MTRTGADAPTADPTTAPAGGVGAPGPGRRHHRRWWALGALALVVVGGVGWFAYQWDHSGARPLSAGVAVQRFRQGVGADPSRGSGPAEGVYLYRGSGTEKVSVPPKSQTEGPGIPGTVIDRPGGCFEFRLDYSDAHWQNWVYCLRHGALVTTSRAGWYRWDFVAFTIADTSTYTCAPAAVTVPARLVPGAREPLSCTGRNDHLSTGLVLMSGTSTVLGTAEVLVGSEHVPAVRVRERVSFSGGQQGSNDADTWFSVATGLPLQGTWRTVVATPSPVGTSTLDAHGAFDLTSLTPRH